MTAREDMHRVHDAVRAHPATARLVTELLAVFGSHEDLNGGDFVSTVGELFGDFSKQIAAEPIDEMTDESLAYWRAIADELGLEHDGPEEEDEEEDDDE